MIKVCKYKQMDTVVKCFFLLVGLSWIVSYRELEQTDYTWHYGYVVKATNRRNNINKYYDDWFWEVVSQIPLTYWLITPPKKNNKLYKLDNIIKI